MPELLIFSEYGVKLNSSEGESMYGGLSNKQGTQAGQGSLGQLVSALKSIDADISKAETELATVQLEYDEVKRLIDQFVKGHEATKTILQACFFLIDTARPVFQTFQVACGSNELHAALNQLLEDYQNQKSDLESHQNAVGSIINQLAQDANVFDPQQTGFIQKITRIYTGLLTAITDVVSYCQDYINWEKSENIYLLRQAQKFYLDLRLVLLMQETPENLKSLSPMKIELLEHQDFNQKILDAIADPSKAVEQDGFEDYQWCKGYLAERHIQIASITRHIQTLKQKRGKIIAQICLSNNKNESVTQEEKASSVPTSSTPSFS